jgi:hypothetical protein
VRFALLLLLLSACSDGEAKGSSSGTSAPPAPAPAPVPTPTPVAPPEVVLAPPSYPDTVQGLQSLMGHLVTAIQADDPKEEVRLLDSLRLSDPRAWFRATFDAKLADKLADEYQPIHDGIGQLLDTLQTMVSNGQTVPEAEQFAEPDQTGATGYQSAALSRMVKRTPLYSVRLKTPDGSRVYHLWSFVHDGGSFRFVGKMRKVEDRPPQRVGGRDVLDYRKGDRARLPADDR